MKTLFLLLALSATSTTGILSGQNIEITFTGDNNGQAVELDSVMARNHSQNAEVMIYPPDLSLILVTVGLEELSKNQETLFSLSQNYPNPFNQQTCFQIHLPEPAQVKMYVSNYLGQVLISESHRLNAGTHSFNFTGNSHSCFFLTVSVRETGKTIKMLGNPSKVNQTPKLSYSGYINGHKGFKSPNMSGDLPFTPGDELLLVGYADTLESGCAKSPEFSQECKFQFAINMACPGIENVTYMGQTYNTIQVFGQCWFGENLNAGKMINSSINPSNNDTIEKYCLANMSSFCDLFGGLYRWNEIMNYTTQNGTRGICPEGWHIPTDLDWRILEAAADSEHPIGDPEWGFNNWRGTDAGGNLKQTGTTNWEYPNTGATNAYDFEALPAGYFVQNQFWGAGYKTYWWSSNPEGLYIHHVDWEHAEMKRQAGDPAVAVSVRCIKD